MGCLPTLAAPFLLPPRPPRLQQVPRLHRLRGVSRRRRLLLRRPQPLLRPHQPQTVDLEAGYTFFRLNSRRAPISPSAKAVWEASKEIGPALKPNLVTWRDMRNGVAIEMSKGYQMKGP